MTVLTQSEAARRLGVSRQRVHQLIQLGRLLEIRTDTGTGVLEEAVKERLEAPPLHWRKPVVAGTGCLSVAETAKATGRTNSTIYRWLNLGWLSGERVSGVWVIPVEHVHALRLPTRGRPAGKEMSE